MKIYQQIKHLFEEIEEFDPVKSYMSRRGRVPESEIEFWDYFIPKIYSEYPELNDCSFEMDGSLMDNKYLPSIYTNELLGVDEKINYRKNRKNFNQGYFKNGYYYNYKNNHFDSLRDDNFINNIGSSESVLNDDIMNINNSSDKSMNIIFNKSNFFTNNDLNNSNNSFINNFYSTESCHNSMDDYSNDMNYIVGEDLKHSSESFDGDVMYSSLIKPFICDHAGCDKKYTSKHGLDYHLSKGHYKLKTLKDKPFKCNYFGCTVSYKSKNGLKYHLKKNHSKK